MCGDGWMPCLACEQHCFGERAVARGQGCGHLGGTGFPKIMRFLFVFIVSGVCLGERGYLARDVVGQDKDEQSRLNEGELGGSQQAFPLEGQRT